MIGDAGDGRVVVVTGANRGLGLEVVRQCAARGDTVVLGSRDADAGRRTADEVDSAFGRVDVLVNNAAIHYDTWQNRWTSISASSGRRGRRTSSAPGRPRSPSCHCCAAVGTRGW